MESMRKNKDSVIQKLIKAAEEQRNKGDSAVDQLQKQLLEAKADLSQKQSQILGLEESLITLKDVKEQLTDTTKRLEESQDSRQSMQKDHESATDYILELEEKVYKANKTSLDLLKQLKDAELEIESLKQYVIDLKHRIAVYIPVKDDQIDKKLAEFINNYPERAKLKIMFMRESEGVYQFGTKRVSVKVEKDKINIRVGGGYLSIDEFLD